MSNTVYTDADVKYWMPPLIEVTLVPNPEIKGGEPTVATIDPRIIAFCYAAKAVWRDVDGKPTGETLDATTIMTQIGHHLSVLESPQEISARRNAALGIRQELKSV